MTNYNKQSVQTWRKMEDWEKKSCHMPLDEFIEGVKSHCFTDWDGYGRPATATCVVENPEIPFWTIIWDPPIWMTHVVWYNK